MAMIAFFGALIFLAVCLAISRIAVDVHKIRQHFDRIDAAAAPAEVFYSEGWWRSEAGKKFGPFKTRGEAERSPEVLARGARP